MEAKPGQRGVGQKPDDLIDIIVGGGSGSDSALEGESSQRLDSPSRPTAHLAAATSDQHSLTLSDFQKLPKREKVLVVKHDDNVGGESSLQPRSEVEQPVYYHDNSPNARSNQRYGSSEQDVLRDLETIIVPMTSTRSTLMLDNSHQDGAVVVTNTSDLINAIGGFSYALNAPTSGMIRRGEDSLTYLNKDQYYSLTLQYIPPPSSSPLCFKGETAVSVVSVQFREKEKQSSSKDAILHWELWMSRQHCSTLRVVDTDYKQNTGALESVEETARNAIRVTWKPHKSIPAVVSVGVKCLSTDFTNQKGVKGIPLHLQVDTFAGDDVDQSTLLDRAFCQVKTFSDKGAERKAREEEKRLSRQPPQYACQPVQRRSAFTRCVKGEFNREAVLFQPKQPSAAKHFSAACSGRISSPARASPPPSVTSQLVTSGGLETPAATPPRHQKQLSPGGVGGGGEAPEKKRKREPTNVGGGGTDTLYGIPPSIMVYVRQENENVFTPLSVKPATVQGFVSAVASKYQIDAPDVRKLYKKYFRGIVVWVDDELIKTFHDCSFLMKVLATDSAVADAPPTSTRATQKVLYDIVLIEDCNNNPSA